MPLRTIARCLRGIASRFASTSGSSVLRNVTYRSCRGHVGLGRGAVAQLEVLDAEIARQVARRAVQRGRARLVGDRRAAVDRERQRHQRVAEEQALHARQRQHADDARRPARRAGSGCGDGTRPRSGRATRCGGRTSPPGTRATKAVHASRSPSRYGRATVGADCASTGRSSGFTRGRSRTRGRCGPSGSRTEAGPAATRCGRDSGSGGSGSSR